MGSGSTAETQSTVISNSEQSFLSSEDREHLENVLKATEIQERNKAMVEKCKDNAKPAVVRDKIKQEGNATDIPKHFLCPITYSLMNDPVVAADGFTYERDAIARWLAKNQTSPMTGEIILPTLTPNFLLRSMIGELAG